MPTIKDIAPESVFTIELNAGTPGIQGPQGPQGVQGPVGPEGKIGPKPIRGIDYFTQQDISNMVSTITDNSNSAFNENVSVKTKEFNNNATDKQKAYNDNAEASLKAYNDNSTAKVKEYDDNATLKVEEYNSNANSKKEELNQISTNFEERITENEKYISELEATIDILTNTNKAKGELVHITDALNLPTFENKIDGNVEQFTTTGKNLFNPNKPTTTLNGITLTNNGNGTYTISGTSTKATGISLTTSNIVLEKGKTYTQSVIVISGEQNGSIVPSFKNSAGEIVYNFFINNSKNTPTDTLTLHNYDYYIAKATTVNFTFKVQLEEGTQATEWEEYSGGQASPNPDYPQEIEVIEGNVDVKVNGKNLLNINGGLYSLKAYPTVIENNKVYVTTASNSGNTISSLLDYIPVEENESYIYTMKAVQGKVRYGFSLYDEDKKVIKNSAIVTGYTYLSSYEGYYSDTLKTFTIPSGYGIKYIRPIIFAMSNTVTPNIYEELMIRRASVTDDTYEPFKEQIVPLDLKGNFVGKIGDIKDYLVTDKKMYWLVKNVGKVVLDGSEYWVKNGAVTSTNAYVCSDYMPNRLLKGLALCDYLKNIASAKGTGIFSGTGLNFCFENEEFDTTEKLKTWLSTHNVTVYYQLATPEIIELGGLPETIKTFEGVNNIQVLANLDTSIETTYVLDLKKYFDNKLAAISAQII